MTDGSIGTVTTGIQEVVDGCVGVLEEVAALIGGIEQAVVLDSTELILPTACGTV